MDMFLHRPLFKSIFGAVATASFFHRRHRRMTKDATVKLVDHDFPRAHQVLDMCAFKNADMCRCCFKAFPIAD